jgi:hypothetical protein
MNWNPGDRCRLRRHHRRGRGGGVEPDIVYVGGGETHIRGNTSHGDGLWKTTDGGAPGR